MADLSVVIPSRDGAERLPETLTALTGATPPPGGAEIIVVDDGSAIPPDRVQLDASELALILVRLPVNQGRAAACNAGVAAARGDIVLILDDDMTVQPDVLAGHARLHAGRSPAVGVIGRIEPDLARFRGRFGRFLVDEEARRHERLRASSDDVSFRDCLTGHFSIRRDVLSSVGGYDAFFTHYGLEDIELAWRLGRRGIRLIYTDDLIAVHHSSHVSFREHCRRHQDVGRMAALFGRRHSDPAVRDFLRIDGMTPGPGASRFLRAMAGAHQLVRRSPLGRRRRILAAARGVARMAEIVAPRRVLHAMYHIVRDMHYAAGIEDAAGARGDRQR